MDDSGSKENINVRSDSYWIGRATGKCDCCRAETQLVALAVPPHHQSLELDPDIEADESVADHWEAAGWSAFLFYVEYLSEQVRRRLQGVSKGYRIAFSERTQGSYWANHCAACGALMEDHDLFCEPDGVFSPTTAESAAAVTLERVDEALEAGVAGYACDPEFLDSMVAS
jgi:hypothetical protein